MRAMLGLRFAALPLVVIFLGLTARQGIAADPKCLPARSEVLRALDADSCEQELPRVSYAMLFEVRSQWQDAKNAEAPLQVAWGYRWADDWADDRLYGLTAGVLFPAQQVIALDPMRVTAQPLVWRDQLYASRSLSGRSAIKRPRDGLVNPPVREADLPSTRTTRYYAGSYMYGFFKVLDFYAEDVVDLGFVNLLMRQSWEALVNGDPIEAERLLGQAWFHDPEGVASHPFLPRIQVLSNALLNAEEESAPKPTEAIAQQIPEVGGEENSESQEAEDATTPDFQAAIPTMTRCALFTVHPILAFWPELQTILDASTTYGGMTLPSPKYLEHPPSYQPYTPDSEFARELGALQAQEAEAPASMQKEGVDASKPVRKDAAPVQIQFDVVVAKERGVMAYEIANTYLHNEDDLHSAKGSFSCVLKSAWEREVLLACLRSLRSAGLAKIMGELLPVTISSRSASILSAGDVALPAGLGQFGLQFEEFGTRLNFLPTVLGDGTLRLEVESEVTPSPEAPAQRSKTTSVLKKGQTLLIAHLSQKAKAKKDTVRPKAGKSEHGEDDEMIVLVTPKIITPDSDVKPAPGREEESEHKNTQKRLRRLEHKLKRLQEELDELKRDR